ncbi:MAG: hypothetical protein RBR96_02885, partial [Candidatus Izemoplasmatales bacterium]|nr:hypothetical protein [Candidatus Izemoplasmatales bacterium]
MKFVVRLKTVEEITELISLGADVFLVDTPLAVKKVGLEMYDFLETIFSYGKEVYLLVNKMIHEED